MEEVVPRSVTPQQELEVVKLILSLRKWGDVDASEKLRSRVRIALLDSPDDSAATAKVEQHIRRAARHQRKLDGSYEAAHEKKRLRREEAQARSSRYVDTQAESGDEDEESSAEEEVVKTNGGL